MYVGYVSACIILGTNLYALGKEEAEFSHLSQHLHKSIKARKIYLKKNVWSSKRKRSLGGARTRKLSERRRLPQRRQRLKAAVTFMRATSPQSSTAADMPRRLHHPDSEVNGKLHFHVPGESRFP